MLYFIFLFNFIFLIHTFLLHLLFSFFFFFSPPHTYTHSPLYLQLFHFCFCFSTSLQNTQQLSLSFSFSFSSLYLHFCSCFSTSCTPDSTWLISHHIPYIILQLYGPSQTKVYNMKNLIWEIERAGGEQKSHRSLSFLLSLFSFCFLLFFWLHLVYEKNCFCVWIMFCIL